MDTTDHEDYKHSAKTPQSNMDVPTEVSDLSGAAVDPSPVHWKEGAIRQLLKLFLSIAAAICPQADLQPFTPAVTEAITMALNSVDRRVREYAELIAHHLQSNTKPDVRTISDLLVENERSIQFYFEERLSVWKKQLQDLVDTASPSLKGFHLDDNLHRQALDQCYHTLVQEMMGRGTTLIDDLVANDVISYTKATEILHRATTNTKFNAEILKAVRCLSAQQFYTSFLPALERENSHLAIQLKSTIRQLQDDARSQSQPACDVCALRDRVDPRHVADLLLAEGLIPHGLYDDLCAKILSTDKAWERIFLHVGHTEKLMPILSKKYPAIYAEMLEKGISSLDCHCGRLSRGLVEVVLAVSEGDVSDIAWLSDISFFDEDNPPPRVAGSQDTDDVISVTGISSIVSKGTDKATDKGIPKVVRFLSAPEREEGNAVLAMEVTSAAESLQEVARSQSQPACDVCALRDRVDPRRVVEQLLARGLIPRDLYDDLRAKTLTTDEAWESILPNMEHTEKLMRILNKKYPAVHAEMLEKGISSLDCRCRQLVRVPAGIAKARSEGDISNIAQLSDFKFPLQKDKVSHPEYTMTSLKRGYCLLVINTKYTGKVMSHLKREQMIRSHAALRDLFRRMGFELIERENLSKLQLIEEARKVAHMDHSASDCLAVVLLTWVGPKDSLLCSDGDFITVRSIRKLFSASRCPSLAGKPKLLYRPWSRGPCNQGGITRTDEEGITQVVPDDADFLEIETCPPQCMTARTSGNNALIHIELLAWVLERHGHEEDFLSCLALANSKMASKTVKGEIFFTAPFHSTLTKKLRLPLLK